MKWGVNYYLAVIVTIELVSIIAIVTLAVDARLNESFVAAVDTGFIRPSFLHSQFNQHIVAKLTKATRSQYHQDEAIDAFGT